MDTLNETGSPTLAFQALYFMLARNIYYSHALTFNPNKATADTSTAEVIHSELLLVPRHYSGYVSVVGTLTVFLATLAITAALFSPTRFSLVENAWHTVAQTSNAPEMVDVPSGANAATDAEAKQTYRTHVN